VSKEIIDIKETEVVKTKRGRPRKNKVNALKKGNRGKVGRPKGDASAIEEYKARMLASPKSREVMDSIFTAALNDDHKNQSAAWKLIVDRIMPLSYFEKDKLSNGRAAVSITINGIDNNDPITIGETIDGQADDV
jgi:hypothetical protein|tara:strand:- start:2650 stop:3054 length:405 start_codon:yes stop_codon:yes gene_type:complete